MKVTRNEVKRAARSMLEAWKAVRIQEIPTLPDWAKRNRILPGEVTARPGPFSFELTPWMIEPSLAVDDPSVSEVVLCMAARMGKTELFMNLIGRTIHANPRNILVAYPDLDKAKKWSAMFFEPMVESTPVFRGLLANRHAKDGDNTALRKKFPGGFIIATGANSPSSFRQVQASVIILDEIDGMENTREGDPVELALRRAENYPDAIKVLASTPTNQGVSRIWSRLEESDYRKWHCLSPRTGKYVVIEFKHLRWDGDDLTTARIHDPDTGEPWTCEERIEAVRNGKWIATRPFNGVRGYWADGLLSLFAKSKGHVTKEHQFANDFLKAKSKGKESLRVWKNTFAAEPWEDEAEKLDWEVIRDERVEDYGTESDELPERVLMLTFAADVQGDRIECEWVGWGEEYESWGLGYTVLVGDPKQRPVWEQLEREVRKEWKHPSGKTLRLARGFIDEGGSDDSGQIVRKWCLRQLASGVMMHPCKGIGRTGSSEPDLVSYNPKRQQRGVRAPTFNVGTNTAKRTIYAHVLSAPPGPHTMHFPHGKGYTDRYFQGLVSEQIQTKYERGHPYKIFVLPHGQRNEPLDVRVYGYAAAVSLNPVWQSLRNALGVVQKQAIRKEDLQPSGEKIEPVSTPQIQNLTKAPAVATKPRRRTGAHGGGWVSNY